MLVYPQTTREAVAHSDAPVDAQYASAVGTEVLNVLALVHTEWKEAAGYAAKHNHPTADEPGEQPRLRTQPRRHERLAVGTRHSYRVRAPAAEHRDNGHWAWLAEHHGGVANASG